MSRDGGNEACSLQDAWVVEAAVTSWEAGPAACSLPARSCTEHAASSPYQRCKTAARTVTISEIRGDKVSMVEQFSREFLSESQRASFPHVCTCTLHWAVKRGMCGHGAQEMSLVARGHHLVFSKAAW